MSLAPIIWDPTNGGDGSVNSVGASNGLITDLVGNAPITDTGTIGLAPIPSGTILSAIGSAPQGIPSPHTLDELLDDSFFNARTGVLARSYSNWEEVSGDAWSVLWMAGQTPGFGPNACAAPIPLLLAESKILGLSDINAAIDIAGGSLVITAGNNPGGGSAASFNIIGGSADTQGGHLVLQGGVATAESGDISGGGVIIMGGNQNGIGTDGFLQLVSRTEIQLYGSNITFNQLGEGIDYSTLTLSSFDPDNNTYSLVAIAPGPAGYVWTSGGASAASGWTLNEGDAAAWSTFVALQNVNLNGFGLKGPPSDAAVNMVISLPDITAASGIPVNAGTLIIGGDINNSAEGYGSDVYIKGGQSQTLSKPGDLYLQGGTNPDNTWGNIHVSAFQFIFETETYINMESSSVYSTGLQTQSSSSGATNEISIAPGTTSADGVDGSDLVLRSGSCTATGLPGNIHIQPGTNGSGLAGSTYINGNIIGIVGASFEVGFGSSTIENSVMITGDWNGAAAPVDFISGQDNQILTMINGVPVFSDYTYVAEFIIADWGVDPDDDTKYLLSIPASAHNLGAQVAVVRVLNSAFSPEGNPTYSNTVNVDSSYDDAGNIQLRIDVSTQAFNGSALIV